MIHRPTVLTARARVVWQTMPAGKAKHAFRLWSDGRPDTMSLCGREPAKVGQPRRGMAECQRCADLLEAP